MRDIVIIPTFDRPEMLWLCLDYLSRCPDIAYLAIRVYVDAHIGQPPPPKTEITEVIEKFPQLSIQTWVRSPHGFHGNSYNVLMAYKEAFETGAEFVYLIEDDVVVRPEFFTWHRLQHEQPLACSIGVEKRPEHGSYASLGVCFRREVLAKILPHCHTGYFQNMQGYCKAKFPPVPDYDRRRALLNCEQDGLLMRVFVGLPVAWAVTPLAQHVGWYGYHRRKSIRPSGTLVERYQQVVHALTNVAVLKEWVKEFYDIDPIRIACN